MDRLFASLRFAQNDRQIQKKTGFTLAEVLLVITVIGVVASLTIPNLISSVQKKQYASGFKEANRLISEVTTNIKEDNGGTLVGAFATATDMRDKYKTYLSTIKQCPPTGCVNNIVWITLAGEPKAWLSDLNTQSSVYLINGMIFQFSRQYTNCDGTSWGYCGYVMVDVNGLKPPNQLGRDVFRMLIAKDGAWPDGSQRSTYQYTGGVTCNPTAPIALCGSYCGIGCGARIMIEGEMNY